MIKRSFLVALSLFMVGAYSCKKESLNVKNSSIESSPQNSSSVFHEKSYTFHYIGSVHNNILDEMVNNGSWNTMTDSSKVVFAKDRTTAELNVLRKDTLNLPHSYLMDYYNHAESFEDNEIGYSDDVRDFFQDSVSFSTTSISYYDDLIDAIADGKDNSVSETKAKINDLAQEIGNDSNLSDEERKLLEGACSVANSSTNYWDEYNEEIEQGLGDWWKKAIADVSGFAGGFIGSLVYNNNNGNWSDVNPFAAGGTVGGMASKLAETDED